MKHTLTALLQDRPGALNRTVSLFRRRGFNIESLHVGPSEMPGLSRVTIVVDEPDIERVVKQLTRLIEVVGIVDVDHPPGHHVVPNAATGAGMWPMPAPPTPFNSQADGASDDVAI
jgi:acetolactate synthase small subunit